MCRTQLGPLAAVAIVALRLMIGLHFMMEGLDKIRAPKPFSSAGFLQNAKGPFASLYKASLTDPDGYRRLNAEATLGYWTTYRDRVARHYGFDEQQVSQTEKLLARADERLQEFFDENEETLDEYYKQLERRDANANKPERAGMETLQTHDTRITGDWMKLKGQLLSKMDALWKNVETDFNNVATPEQRAAAGGPLPIGRFTRSGPFAADFADWFIPWFDLVVGACLIVGLFTRTAALLAGLFLASVCASQWPGSPGAAPVYYQSIEMLALFALAAVGAGKVASIDALLCGCWSCCRPKSAAGSPSRPSQATGTTQ